MKKITKITSFLAIPLLAVGIGSGLVYAQNSADSQAAPENKITLPELPQGFRQWKQQSAPDTNSSEVPNDTDQPTTDDNVAMPEVTLDSEGEAVNL